MKATEILKKQHREVEKLFKAVEKSEDARTRRRLMDEIGEKLKLHTSIEENIFYPAVKAIETKKAEEMVLEAYEEHHVVDLVLAELPKVDPAADTFEAKMTVLEGAHRASRGRGRGRDVSHGREEVRRRAEPRAGGQLQAEAE
jgi:hypothetical protein